MKNLLLGAALVVSGVSGQALAVSIQDVTYENQYALNFETSSGLFSVSEVSNERYLQSDNYIYGLDVNLPSVETFVQVGSSVADGSGFTLGGNVGETNPFVHDELDVVSSGFDFSASTAINMVFDVIGNPEEVFVDAFSQGPMAEYAYTLTGNGVDINGGSAIAGGATDNNLYLLSEGTYTLSANLNILSVNEDSAGLAVNFVKAVSVPAPYTPLLAIAGLVMLLRSRRAAK